MDIGYSKEPHLVKLKPNTNPFKLQKSSIMKVKNSKKSTGEQIQELEIQNMQKQTFDIMRKESLHNLYDVNRTTTPEFTDFDHMIEDKGLLQLHQDKMKIQAEDFDENDYFQNKDRLLFGITPESLFGKDENKKLSQREKQVLVEELLIHWTPKKFSLYLKNQDLNRENETLTPSKDVETEDKDQQEQSKDNKSMTLSSFIQKHLIINPKSQFMKIWQFIVTIGCMWTAFLYPYCTAFGYPEDDLDSIMICLYLGELIMLMDIIFTFFTSYQDEGSTSQITDLKKISNRYIFEKNFKSDVIIWLPLFYFFGLIAEPLKIIALIKCQRFS